jgi:hypothetical protein
MVKQFIKKAKVLSVGAVMAFTMIASAVTSIAASKPAYAATSCDKVNIVYCGVNKGSASSDINTFKSTYNSNKSGHAASPTVKKDYTDLKAVYKWAGASDGIVSGMNSTNTKLGTLYKDGHIVVDGKTVATDSWVTARFSGSGFQHVTSNVYARKTTTSFANASAPVLVNFQNGKMAFAVMTDCGNAVKGTPKTPEQPPKPPVVTPIMSCDLLTATKNGDYDYNFVAKASAENATITNYAFDFGDGQTQNVPTAAKSANASHKYAKAGTFTASVKVTFTANGKTSTLTAAKCATPVKPTQPPTKPEECKPGIPVGDERCNEKPPVPVYACTDLLITPTKDNSLQYSFTVKATADENSKIDAYIVDFGDSTPAYDGADAGVNHTYAKAGSYNIKASVRVTANGKTEVVTAANCAKKVTIEQPMCTVPGKETLPVNSPECKETVTPPTTPETPKTPETPAELPNTGAGNVIGLFSGFSIAGTAAHRLISRRRNS